MDLAELFVAAFLTMTGAGSSSWKFSVGERIPADVVQLADFNDPLAQARLWSAIYPEIPKGFLLEKCVMESGGCRRPVTTHSGDSQLGEKVYRGAWSRHKLARDCAFYPDPSGIEDTEWFRGASTRGNWGLMAAYNVRHLGPCIPFEALDVPFFSAWAAAEKARRACRRYEAIRGRRCSVQALHCHWAQATYGSKACGKVIRRMKKRMVQYRRRLTRIDFDYQPTLAKIRRNANQRQTYSNRPQSPSD